MLLTIFVWAGSWIAMKLVVPYIGPFDFIAVRYLSGGCRAVQHTGGDRSGRWACRPGS